MALPSTYAEWRVDLRLRNPAASGYLLCIFGQTYLANYCFEVRWQFDDQKFDTHPYPGVWQTNLDSWNWNQWYTLRCQWHFVDDTIKVWKDSTLLSTSTGLAAAWGADNFQLKLKDFSVSNLSGPSVDLDNFRLIVDDYLTEYDSFDYNSPGLPATSDTYFLEWTHLALADLAVGSEPGRRQFAQNVTSFMRRTGAWNHTDLLAAEREAGGVQSLCVRVDEDQAGIVLRDAANNDTDIGWGSRPRLLRLPTGRLICACELGVASLDTPELHYYQSDDEGETWLLV